MGCQCAKNQESDKNEILKSYAVNGDNLKQGLNNEMSNGGNYNNKNENIVIDPNQKYADYPQQMLELINQIRQDPVSYADYIERSILNIVEENDKNDLNKLKIIYRKKVKVALTTGEPAFKEAANILKNMTPLPPLTLKPEICIPLPENEEQMKDGCYLREQVKQIRETYNIDVFFKDLIKVPEVSSLLMIVDDNGKNAGKKRMAVLNKDFKYIGINSKFIGKTFIAYFSFSK
jgi:hypothetical protein